MVERTFLSVKTLGCFRLFAPVNGAVIMLIPLLCWPTKMGCLRILHIRNTTRPEGRGRHDSDLVLVLASIAVLLGLAAWLWLFIQIGIPMV
jgi:hypothetical protein